MKKTMKIVIPIIVAVIAAVVSIVMITLPASENAQDIVSMIETGQKYLAELDYTQAIAEFSKVIEIDAKNVDAYLGLANAYIGNGDKDKAVEVLEKGLAETGDARLQALLDAIAAEDAPQETTALTETTPETTTTTETTTLTTAELTEPTTVSTETETMAMLDLVTVPRVVELSYIDAQNILKEAGLNYEIEYADDSRVKKGYVFKQSVASGSELEKGAVVKLSVSTHEDVTTTVPTTVSTTVPTTTTVTTTVPTTVSTTAPTTTKVTTIAPTTTTIPKTTTEVTTTTKKVTYSLSLSEKEVSINEGDTYRITITAKGSHKLEAISDDKSVVMLSLGDFNGDNVTLNIKGNSKGNCKVKVYLSNKDEVFKYITVEVISSTKKITSSSGRTYEIKDLSEAKIGDNVVLGKYNDEAIIWRVIDIKNGKLFLLSEEVIEDMLYNKEPEAVTWETCDLRKWLNNDFYNTAFSNKEKSMIEMTRNHNPDVYTPNGLYSAAGGRETEDLIFILSAEEIINYFGNITYNMPYGDVSKDTIAYCRRDVLEKYLDYENEHFNRKYDRTYFDDFDHYKISYWTRSPGWYFYDDWDKQHNYYTSPQWVGLGLIAETKTQDDFPMGVRPAMWVTLK